MKSAAMLLQNREICRVKGNGLQKKTKPLELQQIRQGCLSAAKRIGSYSSGRRNSNPNRRTSPKMSCRLTLAMMGGVSLGTRLEEAGEGAGIVKCTVCSGRRMCEEVMQAPVALIFRVFVNSINSRPVASEALRKTGTWRRSRGELRVGEESERASSLFNGSRWVSMGLVPEH
jgi:hypothetical protein